MSDRTGELCPFCKQGRLFPTGEREIKEPAKSPRSGEMRREHTEYECDTCHRKTGAVGISLVATLESPSLSGKVREKSGKIASEFLKRQKMSWHGKEAREELHIDIRGNRKFHHVEEKDDKGNWQVVHHEDEPLKKSKEENKSSHNS